MGRPDRRHSAEGVPPAGLAWSNGFVVKEARAKAGSQAVMPPRTMDQVKSTMSVVVMITMGHLLFR